MSSVPIKDIISSCMLKSIKYYTPNAVFDTSRRKIWQSSGLSLLRPKSSNSILTRGHRQLAFNLAHYTPLFPYCLKYSPALCCLSWLKTVISRLASVSITINTSTSLLRSEQCSLAWVIKKLPRVKEESEWHFLSSLMPQSP